jgi:hypothetical protein
VPAQNAAFLIFILANSKMSEKDVPAYKAYIIFFGRWAA